MKINFDQNLLTKIKVEENHDKSKQMQLKRKIDQEKELRDLQLMNAKERKKADYQMQRQSEKEFVTKLKSEIEKEKQDTIEKRLKEKEIC